VDEHRGCTGFASASPPRAVGPDCRGPALLHGVNLPLPAPLPPTGRFRAAPRGWRHVSSPLMSRRSQRALQWLQQRSGQDRGPLPCSGLGPSAGHRVVPVPLLCPTPSSRQANLDGLKGEDAVLPGVEDLQDGGRDAQTRLVPLHLPAGKDGAKRVQALAHSSHRAGGDRVGAPLPGLPWPAGWARGLSSYTSFISEELLRRATRDSTLVESGRKQGWSGLRIFPSSGMQVSIQVSKKGTSPAGLDSDRITWKGTATGSVTRPASRRDPAGDTHPGVDQVGPRHPAEDPHPGVGPPHPTRDPHPGVGPGGTPSTCWGPPPWGAHGWGSSAALWPARRGRHWSAPSRALVSSLWAVVFPPLPEDSPGDHGPSQSSACHPPSGRCQDRTSPEGL